MTVPVSAPVEAVWAQTAEVPASKTIKQRNSADANLIAENRGFIFYFPRVNFTSHPCAKSRAPHVKPDKRFAKGDAARGIVSRPARPPPERAHAAKRFARNSKY